MPYMSGLAFNEEGEMMHNRRAREPKEGEKIAVWFSCGAASAVAAKKTIERYDNLCDIRVVYNPVIEEHEDNLRFLRDCAEWLGKHIELAKNKDWPDCSAETVWKKRKYMAGISGAPCTQQLKKFARQQWEDQHKPDWHVLGFTVDETDRHDRFILTERDNVLPILIEENLNKVNCFEIIHAAGIKRPAIYEMGYPNANCIGCVKASSPAYWNNVRKQHPEIFEKRRALAAELGVRLWKKSDDSRYFLDELPEDFDDGQRDLDFDCGIFCEEKP